MLVDVWPLFVEFCPMSHQPRSKSRQTRPDLGKVADSEPSSADCGQICQKSSLVECSAAPHTWSIPGQICWSNISYRTWRQISDAGPTRPMRVPSLAPALGALRPHATQSDRRPWLRPMLGRSHGPMRIPQSADSDQVRLCVSELERIWPESVPSRGAGTPRTPCMRCSMRRSVVAQNTMNKVRTTTAGGVLELAPDAHARLAARQHHPN